MAVAVVPIPTGTPDRSEIRLRRLSGRPVAMYEDAAKTVGPIYATLLDPDGALYADSGLYELSLKDPAGNLQVVQVQIGVGQTPSTEPDIITPEEMELILADERALARTLFAATDLPVTVTAAWTFAVAPLGPDGLPLTGSTDTPSGDLTAEAHDALLTELDARYFQPGEPVTISGTVDFTTNPTVNGLALTPGGDPVILDRLAVVEGTVTTAAAAAEAARAAAVEARNTVPFDVTYQTDALAVRDILVLPITEARTIDKLVIYGTEPPSGGPVTVAVDKLPQGSGLRVADVSACSITADSRRSGRSLTPFTVDPGDELIVRVKAVGSRAPRSLLVRMLGAELDAPPLKASVTAPTIGTATASGNNVVVTATGGGGPWSNVHLERAGQIVETLPRDVWTGSFTDTGQSDEGASYRVCFSNRDYAAWSAYVGYEPPVTTAADMTLRPVSNAVEANGGGTASTTVIPLAFSQAVPVGEVILVPIARTGNGAALQALTMSGTGITWTTAPNAASDRGIINAEGTTQAYVAVGTVTTARAAGDTVTATFSGPTTSIGSTVAQLFSATNVVVPVAAANSDTGNSNSPAVDPTGTLSGAPAMAVAFFATIIRTVSGFSAGWNPETFTLQTHSGTNDRMGRLIYRTDLTTTAGVGAGMTLTQSASWCGIVVALLRKA